MNTKTLLKTFIVVAVIAALVVTYFVMNPGVFRSPTVLEQAKNNGETEVALNGTVTRRDDNAIYFNTGYMASTAEGTKFVEQEKKVKVLSSTKIYMADEVTETELSKIFTGAVITVQIPINTLEMQEVTATKVVVDRP